MKEFLKALVWGTDDKPSLTSTMAATAFSFFVIVSAYLVITGKSWPHYDVFASVTCGGGLFAQLGGKYINNSNYERRF